MLFYEGLHGGVVTPQHDVASHVDLLVGVVPIVNLEWIKSLFATPANAATPGGGDGLGRPLDGRLHQLHYAAIFPHPYQLSARADGGHLQPVCRQSDPSLDESFVVIHFRNLQNIDFPGCWRCCRARLSRT